MIDVRFGILVADVESQTVFDLQCFLLALSLSPSSPSQPLTEFITGASRLSTTPNTTL